MSERCLEGVCKVFGRCLEGVWKVFGRCLEGVWKVSSLCPTSPIQLGTNFYMELKFDSGADPAFLI